MSYERREGRRYYTLRIKGAKRLVLDQERVQRIDMEFFEEYQDVLQNIEFVIVWVHDRLPDLLDYHIEAALDALITHYKAKERSRIAAPAKLDAPRQAVYDEIRKICEWRLGKPGLESEGPGERPPAKEVSEIIACLRYVKRSVQRWNKRGGHQGYLTFVRQYVR